jgi:hypothetical protein
VDDPLDDRRVSDVTRARWLGLILAAAIAGCGSTTGPSAPASPSTAATADPAPSPSSPIASPTPIAGLTTGLPVPLDAILLICESWGSEPPSQIVGCREAASLALAAVGPVAGEVGRLDFGYGEPCPSTPCPSRDPGIAWVVVSSTRGNRPVIRVARDVRRALQAWPPEPGPAAAIPTFTPPPALAPDLGADAPPGVRDREPVPFCGDEDLGTADRFETVARRCFVDGILAGSPVELISRAPSTEGGPVVTLYRWTGRGSVRRDVRSDGRWSASICAITPLATDAGFVLAGGCDPVAR